MPIRRQVGGKCKHGHLLTEDNVVYFGKKLKCRTCRKIHRKKFYDNNYSYSQTNRIRQYMGGAPSYDEKSDVCEMCKKKGGRIVFDHNHKTQRFRGFLCYNCNIRLGWYETYKDQILEYLERTNVLTEH